MVRRATKKERKRFTRKRNDIILVATEGNNKTEKTYFQDFNKSLKGCKIVFSSGNNTDPVKVVSDAITAARNKGIELESGDAVFAVFDTDFNKESQIVKARKLAEKNRIELILSNPCFEVWLLLHFRYSTHGYQANHDVLTELVNRWPAYRKNIESFQYLQDRSSVAVENALRLKHYHRETKGTDVIEQCNPSTDVQKILTHIVQYQE